MEARQQVYQRLDALGLVYTVSEHPPVYTIEEMERLELDRLGTIVKNLFLRDAKGRRHFLVMMRHDKKVDLKTLRDQIGSTPLRFASPERLARHLGLESGAVSPFGLFNDRELAVEAIMDEDLRGLPQVGVHPNDNMATVWLSGADLEKAILAQGHSLTHLRF